MNKILSIGKHMTVTDVSEHSHDYWEVVCCTNGSGKFVYNGSELSYKKYNSVIIPPKITHSNVSGTGFSNIHMIMDNLGLPTDRLIIVNDNPSHLITHAFQQAYYIYNSEMPNKAGIMDTLGDLIGNCLLNFLNTKRYSILVEQIQSDIIKNFTDVNFNLKQLLSEKPYSPDYTRKKFTQETGITPHQFLTDIRINHAKKLLKSKMIISYNISEIARECGFDDALYFSRLFKQYTGVSPTNYEE